MAGTRLIERARLIEPLAASPIIVLAASGGHGKTTLAEQLVEHWGVATVRVRLRDHTTPDGLVDGLRRGLRRAGLGDVAAAMVDDGADAIDEMVGLLHERTEPTALVVDDVQHLDGPAWSLLDGIAADLPSPHRLIICGRALPAPLQRRRGVELLGPDDLRMTIAEVAEVLGDAPTGTSARDLAHATGGWPAAVAIGAERLRSDPTWSSTARSAGAALLASMLEPLIGEDRPSWGRLAQVPLLDERVAELLAGPGSLTRLSRSALPVRIEQGRWTVIPDSVRDALGVVARAPIEPVTLAAIAQHYADVGELAAAIQVATSVEDPEVLASVLASRHWTDLEGMGLTPLAQLIAGIPDAVLARHARLLVQAALAAEARRPALRAELLDRALALPGVAAEHRRAALAEHARDLVRAVRLDECIELAEQVIAEAGPGERMTLGRSHLAIAHAHAFKSSDQSYAVAERRFEVAAELLELAGEHRLAAEALARLGYNVLFHHNRPVAAAGHMERALALLPIGDRGRATWLTSYADVLDWLGAAAESDAAVAEAIEIGERLRDHNLLALAQWSRAWTVGRRGDIAGTRACLEEVERLRPAFLTTSNGVEFYGSLADIFVAHGDAASLERCRTKAEELGRRLDYPQAIDMMNARIEALTGDAERALDLLRVIDDSIGAAANTRWVRRLEAAVAAQRLGRPDDARRYIDQSLELCEEAGLPDLPQRLEAQLVARLAPVWPRPAGDAEPPSVLVNVTTLGTFAVRSGAQDLTPPAGHPSTLVKLLVLRSSMTVDGVIDALWPDADIDTGRARLRNTMNRLRTRSGPIVERRGDTLELAAHVRTDLAAFEQAAAEALAADSATRVGLARQAVALYAGELLPGDAFEDWAAAPRERLLRRYLSLVDLVADAAAEAGNADEAARLLDLGIAADPLDEQRYVRLAEMLAHQGRPTTARQVADRAISVFAELGLPPSAALRRLAADP